VDADSRDSCCHYARRVSVGPRIVIRRVGAMGILRRSNDDAQRWWKSTSSNGHPRSAVRGVGALNKELVSSNIRSKHGRNKKKQKRRAIVLPFAVVVVFGCGCFVRVLVVPTREMSTLSSKIHSVRLLTSQCATYDHVSDIILHD
jgi:hypothetical protein